MYYVRRLQNWAPEYGALRDLQNQVYFPTAQLASTRSPACRWVRTSDQSRSARFSQCFARVLDKRSELDVLHTPAAPGCGRPRRETVGNRQNGG